MAFDPYHKWLGISKERRPITYYDLLGVETGEGDTDVLRSALNQRRDFVRGKLGEGHDDHVNKILGQLDVAASTLLVPEIKHKYDRKLASLGRRVAPQARKARKASAKERRRSVVLPSFVEHQVVRVYGEGSGIVGDFFGITAIIVAGIAIMVLLASQMTPGELPSGVGDKTASAETASVETNEIDSRTADLRGRREELELLLRQAETDKEEIVAKLRQSGVTSNDDLKNNLAARRLATELQRTAQDIEAIQHEIEKLDEAVAHANTLKRRAEQETLSISDEELARLSVDAKRDMPRPDADKIGLEELLAEELGEDQGAEQETLSSSNEKLAEVSARPNQSMSQDAARAASLKEPAKGPQSRNVRSDGDSAEFVALPEIEGSYLSLTEDGSTVFWEGRGKSDSAIFTARREDSESYFENQQQLFPGRHPAISADGLELIFLAKSTERQHRTLHATVRESVNDPFPRAEEISELREVRLPKSPFLSSDGLVLCFTRFKGRGETETVFSTRRSKEDRWSAPRTLAINPPALKGAITWPSLSSDGMILFATHEQTQRGDGILGDLMVWKRDSRDEPFQEYSFVEIDDCPPLQVRAPRYVGSTQELFISGHPRSSEISGNGVIKNFQLP